MGWRGTLILALAVLAVGAYVWFEEPAPVGSNGTFLDESRPSPAAESLRPLLVFEPEQIISIRIEQEGHSRSAERDSGTWHGTDDPQAVDDFLRNLSRLGVLADIPAKSDELVDYGLQSPRTVVQMQQRARTEPLVFQIGDRNPATTGVYVRLGRDGEVVLAGALVAWEVDNLFARLQDQAK